MKNVLCIVLGVVLGSAVKVGAQDLAPFKVNVAVGYASPADQSGKNDDSKPGLVYSIEPQYRLINHLDVGLRFEQAFIQRPEYLDETLFFPTKTKSILSAALTANYSIATGGKLQPYVGIGVGGYYAGKSEQTYQLGNNAVSYPLPATVALGGLARVGVKFGLLNLEADYNLVSNTRVTNAASRLTMTAKNSYFSVKAGFTIGKKS